MRNEFPYRLYLVVSEAACKLDLLQVVEEAIVGGVDIVQLREKSLRSDQLLRKAEAVKAVTDRYGIPLIMNDDLEVARQLGCFGIHVGIRDVSPLVIRKEWDTCRSLGYSLEYLTQLDLPEAAAADHFGISPVFTSRTKTDTVTTWGLTGLAAIRRLTSKPLIAIGDMNEHNVKAVIQAGADCVAVVSAICGSDDPRSAAFRIKQNIIEAYENKEHSVRTGDLRL